MASVKVVYIKPAKNGRISIGTVSTVTDSKAKELIKEGLVEIYNGPRDSGETVNNVAPIPKKKKEKDTPKE